MGKLESACRAAASYLYFQPEDEEMMSNRAYYLEEEGASPEWFAVRPEAREYERRDAYERRLLQFVDEGFRQEDKVRHHVLEAFDPVLKRTGVNGNQADIIIATGSANLGDAPIPPPPLSQIKNEL